MDRLEFQGTMMRVADPSVKRAWLTTDLKTSSGTIRALHEFSRNLNSLNLSPLQLELDINLGRFEPNDLEHMGRIVHAAQDIDAGIEHRSPKIRICAPYDLVSEASVELVNQLDIYNPPIEFYVLVPGSHMSCFYRNDLAGSVGSLLLKHRIRFHAFLLLSSDGDSLQLLKNGKVEEFLEWLGETPLGAYPPVFEVSLSPQTRRLSGFAEPVLMLAKGRPTLLESSTSIYCGLLSHLNKAIKMYDLLEDRELSPTPILSSCGTASVFSSLLLPGLTRIQACPYRIPNLEGRLSVMREKCSICPWVTYCSGCLKALSLSGECRLQPYYSAVVSILNEWPRIIGKFIAERAEIPILQHDWDYIYDPFDIP